MKLKKKLTSTFLLIALIPTLALGIISCYTASSALTAQAFSQLVSVREIKKSQISSYFAERKNNIEMLPGAIDRMLDSTSPSTQINSAHEHHGYFENFINTYGYYDLFLIDHTGEIFYTVTREADYQTNLVSGAYKDSGLGRLFKQVSSTKQFAMADFSRYAPSNNAPAGFIALPFTTAPGQTLVVALQLSIDSINRVMQQREGMGESGESYLVGSDLLMRSDSYLDPNGHSVSASFAGDIQNNGVDTRAAQLAIKGETGNNIITDYNGNPVLSAYSPLDIYGARWAILSEIDVTEAFAPVYRLYWTLFFVVLSAIIAIIALALVMSKSILRPLAAEPKEMRHIAETISGGDLTIAFEQNRENASVYGAMKKMTLELKHMVGEIVHNSINLASLSQQTSASSLQSTESLQEQQGSIEQIATAIEQMAMSIHDVAGNTSSVATSTASARSQSGEASEKLNQAIRDLNHLDNEIIQTSAVIQGLADNSVEIGLVLEVIRGIAEQTNLLALNAAIEAARAGEQGRGFAVVADEVRTLASKTQESTQNIESMISKLQSAASEAVNAIATSHAIAEQTIGNTDLAARSVDKMNDEMGTITEMAEAIASAVEQQSSVSTEISQNISTISQVAYENAASAGQVSAASEEISTISSTLNQLSLKFKVS
ncbi:methyl-accepting chemotaxis protein [Thalassomonas actiniarum]|uniref:Methyl-accepting chemotaxis protein n=1 Tax=Thalassomonas actiniarum TaxID=485447 RepID=A0AAE9YRY8_9GAMM|nr:methyl-accepting chemotaxis protein [Thalassomonas actiniarum]WDD99781.1 methyl-accepting chemotaxis protein [Thalassomonas actiniarum]